MHRTCLQVFRKLGGGGGGDYCRVHDTGEGSSARGGKLQGHPPPLCDTLLDKL